MAIYISFLNMFSSLSVILGSVSPRQENLQCRSDICQMITGVLKNILPGTAVIC